MAGKSLCLCHIRKYSPIFFSYVIVSCCRDTNTNLLRSYGSVIATHLLRAPRIAQKIGPVLFIDPVCFLLHLPDVAYNFVWSSSTPEGDLKLIIIDLS